MQNKGSAILIFTIFTILGLISIVLLDKYSDLPYQHLISAVMYFLIYIGFVAIYNVIYLVLNDLFPTLYFGTAFGVCNILSRLVCCFAPLFAQVKKPIPFLVLSSAGICSIILTLQIRKIYQKKV